MPLHINARLFRQNVISFVKDAVKFCYIRFLLLLLLLFVYFFKSVISAIDLPLVNFKKKNNSCMLFDSYLFFFFLVA